jgi:hypothetical protein
VQTLRPCLQLVDAHLITVIVASLVAMAACRAMDFRLDLPADSSGQVECT